MPITGCREILICESRTVFVCVEECEATSDRDMPERVEDDSEMAARCPTDTDSVDPRGEGKKKKKTHTPPLLSPLPGSCFKPRENTSTLLFPATQPVSLTSFYLSLRRSLQRSGLTVVLTALGNKSITYIENSTMK